MLRRDFPPLLKQHTGTKLTHHDEAISPMTSSASGTPQDNHAVKSIPKLGTMVVFWCENVVGLSVEKKKDSANVREKKKIVERIGSFWQQDVSFTLLLKTVMRSLYLLGWKMLQKKAAWKQNHASA